MITGRVRLEAVARDPEIGFVKWQAGDRSRTSAKPFEFFLDAGPVPEEKTVIATALDRERRPLYRVETLLNPGGRRITLHFVAPLDGQSVSGSIPIFVRAAAPPGEALASLAVDVDGRGVTLEGDGDLRSARVDLADSPSVLTARATTTLGRSVERSILLNARGLRASLDAHVVEQMVAVTKGGEPVEGLQASDFHVKDDGGACEIREARLVRDVNLSIGVSIDTSQSLLYTTELRRAVASQFLRILGPRDTAFLQRFGVTVGHVLDWTSSRKNLEEGVLGLDEDPVPGTLLHAAIVDALYQLQGGEGARALLLVTDGNAFEDELPEKEALAFARQAGVPIFALALPWVLEVEKPIRVKDEHGNLVESVKVTREEQPPNRVVLHRFTEATGGRTYVVENAARLPALLTALERDLRTRYLVSFVSNAKRTGSFHPVEIRASRGSARTAAGFFY
jgi:VWFA-related protein